MTSWKSIGKLQIKKGKCYVVFNLKVGGKRKPKRLPPLGLTEGGRSVPQDEDMLETKPSARTLPILLMIEDLLRRKKQATERRRWEPRVSAS